MYRGGKVANHSDGGGGGGFSSTSLSMHPLSTVKKN